MAIQLSETVRNARLDAIETAIGNSAVLKIRDGAVPANVAAADTGNALAVLNLPSDWMLAAATGQKAKSGTWEDLTADLGGTATYFRIYASDGTTPHIQGTCGIGTGDLQLDNTNIQQNQKVTVTGFTLTDNNS